MITLRLEKPLDTPPDGSTQLEKLRNQLQLNMLTNNLRASTLNALLLLTTGTSIHVNFSIYIHHIHLYTKNERKIFANKCKEPETPPHRLN